MAAQIVLLRELETAWDAVTSPGGAVDPARLDLTGVHVLGVLQWAALAVPVALLAGVFVMRAVRRLLDLRVVLRKQWVVLVGALGFVAVVLVPDQSADAVRRLALPGLVLTVLAVGLLGLVLTLAGSTALRPRPRPARRAASPAASSRTRRGRGGGWRRRWCSWRSAVRSRPSDSCRMARARDSRWSRRGRGASCRR